MTVFIFKKQISRDDSSSPEVDIDNQKREKKTKNPVRERNNPVENWYIRFFNKTLQKLLTMNFQRNSDRCRFSASFSCSHEEAE
jgi:hypothetical protein